MLARRDEPAGPQPQRRTEPHPMTSEQEYREEQIKAAARSVRGEEFEHAVVLTRDGDVYWRGTNRARTYVQTPPDMPGGAIVVHNHPNECGSPWCAGRCALRDDAPLSHASVGTRT